MFMADLRAHYASGGKPASRSFIYDAQKRGDIPPSTMFGGKRVWSRKAVIAMDEARFAEAAQNGKAA
ncbi:hypothetical protein OZ411_28770 [Bradyrhizobium sp. Arg237L]|uniref:hypothetical protein n=1 Tax=Bradyrhizobium sp. Arg237L TaxID=3003352 RepID=UPI00249ED8CB|nr:hypothetical protein [Bradyrhizobium sp. Arg237L]MDI4236811.1 hypothetical protein [Bradyrhizobium sp. Arg237L]